MNSSSNITSLSDIQERKKQLESELDYSQKALIDSVTPASVSAKNFLLQDLIVPAIGVGAALFLASRLMSKRQKKNSQIHEERIETVYEGYSHPSASKSDYQRPVRERKIEAVERPRKKRFSSLIKLGSVIIPAAQAIMTAVQDSKGPKRQ